MNSGPLAFLTNLFAAGLSRGTPLWFAALGELFAERAGVMNLGVEGMMLLGGATGFVVAVNTQSLLLGFAAAIAAGALISLLHGLVTITLVGDQVVSGLGLGFLSAGLSSIIGANYVGIGNAPRAPELEVAGLSEFPLLGPLLFKQNSVVYLGLLLIPLAWLYLYRTRWGLWLRAVGEHPAAADAQAISVARTRYLHLTIGGALAGLGGACLSLAITPGWVEGLTAGQGWIAIGLVIFGGWDPLRCAGGAYLFGIIRRLPLDLQGVKSLPLFSNPNLGYFLNMLPYLFVILVLIKARREGYSPLSSPASLGKPFLRGGRS